MGKRAISSEFWNRSFKRLCSICQSSGTEKGSRLKSLEWGACRVGCAVFGLLCEMRQCSAVRALAHCFLPQVFDAIPVCVGCVLVLAASLIYSFVISPYSGLIYLLFLILQGIVAIQSSHLTLA